MSESEVQMSLYSISQLANIIGKTERTVLRWIDAGTLPVERKIGHSYQINEDVLTPLRVSEEPKREVTPKRAHATDKNELVALAQRVEALEVDASSSIDMTIHETAHENKIDELERRITVLENDFSDIQDRLRRIETFMQSLERPLVERVEKPATEKLAAMPAGSILVAMFASQHGYNYKTLVSQIKADKVPSSSMPHPSRKERILFFTLEQQKEVIKFWNKEEKVYTQCDHCPHS
jgi:hypothetical protein